MGNYYSRIQQVISGLVQGSSIGAVVFTMLINSLLWRLHHLTVAFADDVTFLADVAESSQAEVHKDIDGIDKWSSDNKMPLSLEKSLVMHIGRNQPIYGYHLQGNQLKTADCYTDLRIIRSTNHGYRDYIDVLLTKASRTARMPSRAFQTSSRQLLRPVFQSYLLPMLIYCSPAWCPNLQVNIDKLDRIQQHFTKRIYGLRDLSYNERLQSLGALSFRTRRLHADMIIIYKASHGLMNINPTDIGLSITSSSTRGTGLKLSQQLIRSKYHASYFACKLWLNEMVYQYVQ